MNQLPSPYEKHIRLVVEVAVAAACFLVMLNRVRYGLNFTDEGWYVAEPYIAAKGAHPYSEIWSQAPGVVFPLLFVFKAFLGITGGTEGIVLFSRCLYLVWLLIVTLAVWRNVKRIPLPLVLPLFLPNIFTLYDINYNTIGYAYLPLAASLLFLTERSEKKEFRRGVLAGVVIARAIIGTPMVAVPCIMIAVFLLLQRRYVCLKGYVIGGVSFALVTVLYCSLTPGGIMALVHGLRTYLTEGSYLQIPKYYVLSEELAGIVRGQRPFGICLLGCMGCRLLLAKKPQVRGTLVLAGMTASALCGIYLGLRMYDVNYFIRYTWYIGVLLVFFCPKFQAEHRIGYVFIALMQWAQYLCSSLGNVFGTAGRSYILFFASISSLWALYENYPVRLNLSEMWGGRLGKIHVPLRLCVVAVLAVSTLSMLLRVNYHEVFLDEPVASLTECVDSGIWKGIYTTSEHVEAAKFFESTIRDMTEPGDQVLFLDWASFAYLMSDGEAFTPSVLDNLTYSYGTDNPAILYSYFEMRQDIPEKIIYVDYGRDEVLSIENESWTFNQFVEEHYEFIRQEQWQDFRVLLYQQK